MPEQGRTGAAAGAAIGAAEGSLSPPPFQAARAAIGRLLHWHYRTFRSARHQTVVLEHLGDIALVILPGVLNPRLMRSGEFFASELRSGAAGRGALILDMGTGSGVCALAAARHARRVTAVDISPAAVRCARVNALINGLEHRIEILQGDLFAPLRGRRFDVVLFNPPFLRGAPADDADRAWRSTDVAERFAAGLGEHLEPAGFALVVLSTFGDAGEFLRQFRRHNFAVTPVATRVFVNERLVLLKVSQAVPDPVRGEEP